MVLVTIPAAADLATQKAALGVGACAQCPG